MNKSQNKFPVFLIYILFFMWGFIWNLFNILASFLKETFELNNLETSLGASLSFLAFFLISYPAKILIDKKGTQFSISLGTGITSIGLFIFIMAAHQKSYFIFLAGLMVLFAGVTILQTVCNPYIGILGTEKNRGARINFAQGVGAVGAALTAPLGGWFILEYYSGNVFDGIKYFYGILGVIFLFLAVIVIYTDLPPNTTEIKKEKNTEKGNLLNAFSFLHFRIGLIIMFLYMGVEAILGQLMTPYFKEIGETSTAEAVKLSGIFFYGLMVGRLLGAGIMTKVKIEWILGFFASAAALLLLSSMVLPGKIGIYSITATGFFASIMFASIYSLATRGLGTATNQASSFLIMAISGGFFIPLLYGLIADVFSLKTSLLVIIIPFILSALYGFLYRKVFREKASDA